MSSPPVCHPPPSSGAGTGPRSGVSWHNRSKRLLTDGEAQAGDGGNVRAAVLHTRRSGRSLRSLRQEKGISVIDMGLVRSVEVEDGIAKVELLLASGWCPSRPPCSPRSRTRSSASPECATPTSRSSGTKPGPRPAVAPGPGHPAVPAPSLGRTRPGRLHRRPLQGTAMIDDAFVFDCVAHVFNFDPKKRVRPGGPDVRQPPVRVPQRPDARE